MNTYRLQRYLASCGLGSRRYCETLISAGRVSVNGKIAELGAVINPETDTVAVDGKSVTLESRKVYILLYKPADVVTTARDPQGRKTVLDCLREIRERVFPVGRLDADVEGALLLTNDGELAYRLTHPKFGIKKVYHARVAGSISPEAIQRLRRGVLLEDGPTAPAQVRVLRKSEAWSEIELIIHEGRKREVKRMCASVGHPVLYLRRIAFAGLSLKGLRRGEWRHLNTSEIQDLRVIAGLSAHPQSIANRMADPNHTTDG
ncbi:MAG TPA: pseudouridine synthase [Candidatus Hydrogenedentes bacterium]|nr:pseudouridine synthase [Candidatus Hydrogenedentota bacterium]HPU98533.1 pseudouridine synthase [Candidatus Hydrogenedentota bacterium]